MMEHDPIALRQLAKVARANGYDVAADSHDALADLVERHAKLEAEHADALRAFKAERERAGKVTRYAGLLTIACEKVLTDDNNGWRDIANLLENAIAEQPANFDAALAAQEGK